VTDVKTQQNIWKFNHYKHLSKPVAVQDATSFFSDEEKRFAEDIPWKTVTAI